MVEKKMVRATPFETNIAHWLNTFFLFFLNFPIDIFLVFPFCVWTSCSTEYLPTPKISTRMDGVNVKRPVFSAKFSYEYFHSFCLSH